MSVTAALVIACLLSVAAIALLRLARTGKRPLLTASAWAAMILSAFLSGWAAGAWGIAVTVLCGMAAAAVAVGIAAATPATRQKAPATVRTNGKAESRELVPRIVTALLTIVGGFAASLCFGLAVRGGAAFLGASEADANAAALFLVPVGWAVLFTWMLMVRQRRLQLAGLAVFALPGLAILIPGMAS